MSEPPAPVVYARKSVPVIESLIEPEAYQQSPQQDDAASNADFTPLTPITFEFAAPLPPQQGAISNGLDNSSGTEDDEDDEDDDDEEDDEIDSRILNAALTGSFHKDSYNTLAMKSAATTVKKAVKMTNGQHIMAKKNGRGRPCLPPGAAKQRTPRKPHKFFCEDCPKSFPTKEKFDAHCANHSADKYECECCDKVFRLKTSLKQHEMLHKMGTEPFLCRKCSRTFILKQSWHTHVKSCDGVIMNEGSLNDGKRRSSSFAGRKPVPPLAPSPGITAQKSGEHNYQLLPIKKRGRPPLIKQQGSQQNTITLSPPPIKTDITQEIPATEDVFFEVIEPKAPNPPPATPEAVVVEEDKPKKEEVVKEIPIAKVAVVKIEKVEKTKQVQKVKVTQEMSQAEAPGSEGRSQRKRNPPKWMTEEDMVMDYDGSASNNKGDRFSSNKQQQIKSPEPVKKAEQPPPPPPKLAPKPTNSPAVATRKSRTIPPLPELISAVQTPKSVVAARVVQKTPLPLPPRNPSGRFLKTKSEQKNETEDIKVVQPVLESTRKSQRNILAQEKKPLDDKKINESKGESVPRVLLSRFTPQRPQVKVADVPVEKEEPMEIETEELEETSTNSVSTNSTEITELIKDEEFSMATEETTKLIKSPEKVVQSADIPKSDVKEDVVEEESETQPKEKLLKKETSLSLPPLIPLIPSSPSGLATRKRKLDTSSPSKSNESVTPMTPNEPVAATTNGVNESPDFKRSRQSTPKKTQPPKIDFELATEENNICAKIDDSTLQVNGTSESGSNKTFAGMPKLLNQSGLSVVDDETDNSSDDEFDPSQGGEQSGSELYIKDTVMRFLANKISNRNMLRIRQELLSLKQSGNYFKLTKTAPMAAGLVHDMFCGVFSSSSSNESNN